MAADTPDLVEVDCPLCGTRDFTLCFPATASAADDGTSDRFRCTSPYLSQHRDIVRCNRCRMIYVNPQLAPERLLEIYSRVEDPLYLEEEGARERTFTRSLRQLENLVSPPGCLLDVGCYAGVFMRVAAAAGWTVTGVEPSLWAAAIARREGVGAVHSGSLEKAGLKPGSFDVICIWDVIEHLGDPAAMLREIRRLLKPGGFLALSTHLLDSPAARLLGPRYPFLQDMHVVHFTRSTLQRILADTGFEVISRSVHRRVLRLGYLLDRMQKGVRFPPLRWLAARLGRSRLIREYFVSIGFMGLVNVFARAQSSAMANYNGK